MESAKCAPHTFVEGSTMQTLLTSSPAADTPAPGEKTPEVASIGLLRRLSLGHDRPFAVRLWTGDVWTSGNATAEFTLALKHPGALRAMLWPADKLGLGESYIFGDYDIEGDILAFTAWLGHILDRTERLGMYDRMSLLWDLGRLPDCKNPRDPGKAGRPTKGINTRDADRDAIEYTYDVPGEFYELFLDRNLQYTCSYFADANEDIETSQRRKLDYVCRKLRLKSGERYVDFGCGWGGLLIHAAKHYGVEAVGVTLSGEQAAWAKRAIAEAGLSDRISIVLSDYRDFSDAKGFDKASSVGMSEHIGVKNLPVFLGKIHSCLRPGGAYLHHCIMLRPDTPYPPWTNFSCKYVFPNGELQTIVQTVAAAAGVGFDVRDVENLREHYVLTLQNWVRKLEANCDKAVAMVGEVSYRIFRIYMATGTMAFASGVYALNQCLLAKPDNGCTGMPLTRAEWYR
jgi:cyclopropane-fatty-acyl-phospholipid synthase